MKAFENLKQRWNSLSAGEKVKTLVSFVCDIGGGFLGSALASKLVPEDAGRIKRWTMRATLGGVGMAASTVATNEYNQLIDIVLPEKKEVSE